MALSKKIVNSKGVEVNYIRIASIVQQYADERSIIVVNVFAYKDATYRNMEKESASANPFDEGRYIEALSFRLPIDDTKGYDRASIYTRLKLEVPELANSTDI